MFFASPLWLFGLFPWAGITLWLLWGQRRRVQVPFLELWRGAIEEPPRRRAVQAPPVALVLALLAALLGVLAAARPSVHSFSDYREPLTLIVDRSAAMSAITGDPPKPRYARVTESVLQNLKRAGGIGSIRLVLPPSADEVATDAASVMDLLRRPGGSTDTSRELLERAVSTALRTSTGPIAVVTDRPWSGSEPRVVVMSPEDEVQDVGIKTVSARLTPTPQIMIRVLNQSTLARAPVSIAFGTETIQKTIDLPARGGERDYFFDLTCPAKEISVQLKVHDDFSADDGARLVLQRNWPRIVTRKTLSPALQRFVATYQALRAAGDESRAAVVVERVEELVDGEPGLLLPSGREAPVRGDAIVVHDHPLTRGIDWNRISILENNAAPPAGWSPLLSAGGRTLIAASPSPPRQAWIGIDTDRWASNPQFVIFWSNVFDWLGERGEHYAAKLTPPPVFNDKRARAPRPDLTRLRNLIAKWELSPWLDLAALVCLLGAALTWERRRGSGRHA